MITKIMSVILTLILALTSFFSGVQGRFRKDDVVIIYTNDVHCAVDGSIGYAGLAAYKNEMEEQYRNVTLVDAGDFTQGGAIGSLSKGEYIIDIMNYVGYDYAVLGNHEFDYGMEQLSKNIEKSDFEYLGCNLTYSGSGESLLSDVADYAIEDYGDVQVAFIGITTPYSITSSTPDYFKDGDGNYIYGFEESLTKSVQECAVKARLQGADYVVCLSHLGDNPDEYTPYSAEELIEGTAGIDVVLDAHAHHVIESRTVKNMNGDDVILSSTGTGLVNIGTLTITKSGDISAELINDYDEKDSGTAQYVSSLTEKATADLRKVVAHSDVTLSIYDENGIRTVRSRENAVANLASDAYRTMLGADIAFANGGGVRADIKAGDVTYEDIYNVNPFGNRMCTIEATGQQIADALEWACRLTQSEYTDGSQAVGENGGFLQPSGLKYTIDTSVPSGVKEENGMFVSVSGERRVKDIQVLENGEYVPIDMNKTYVVAGSAYVLLQNGDGMTAFDGCKVINENGPLDYEILINYITDILGGTITAENAKIEGRITVI